MPTLSLPLSWSCRPVFPSGPLQLAVMPVLLQMYSRKLGRLADTMDRTDCLNDRKL